MPQLFAEVAVNSTLPHRQTFSYAVPDGMPAAPGWGAYVPFGRQTLQGVIVEVHGTPVFSEPEKIRAIRSLIGDAPLLDDAHLALARWIAGYYLAPVFDAIALMLPPGFERKPVTVVRALVDNAEVAGIDLPPRQRETLNAVAGAGAIDAAALRERVPGADNAVLQLERRGLVARQYTLAPPTIGARSEKIVLLTVAPDAARQLVAKHDAPRASRRAAVLQRLTEKRRISDDEAIRLAGGRPAFERLLQTGAIRPDRDGHNVELAISRDEALAEIAALSRTKRATEALTAIDSLAKSPGTMADLRAAGTSTDSIRWLAAVGVVRIDDRAVERDPLAGLPVTRRAPATLLPAQATAADAICAAIAARRHETFLLHGVTGSGKTEVYLHALDRCLAAGRRAIVLVPEIALTPQTVRRFRERIDRVAVLHSGLTERELFDQWHGIAAGRYDVVVGARSAVFAPQPDLGLIVLDEEHEWTYKQHEAQPRYHARETAIELGRLTRSPVVLGSATPDVVSFEHAERKLYTLLELPERIRPDPAGAPRTSPALPEVAVVDLREELRAGNRSMFSGALTDAMQETLAAGDQAILFLNRRGLAGHVQCRDCGFVPDCSSCVVALTYHKQFDRLVCHQCNRQTRLPAKCPQCGSPRFRLMGAGVEKVEAEAARAFPTARLLRWDRDVTRGRRAHERILASFMAHEADILIGTQMLAKGLDLPSVTLVGVVSADVGLHLPDFRAGERTFQLLTQVAGRAGRGEKPGRVIIQTYSPEHYAIDAASRHDYGGFADRELSFRRDTRYPPYARLVRLLFSHTNARFAREEAMRLEKVLSHKRLQAGSDDEIVGPSPAYVARVRGHWRWQLLIRGRDPASLIRGFVLPPNWTVDVDPATVA